MEYIRKLRLPNTLKVIEFKYPKENLNKYDNLTSDFSELSSINTKMTGMTGGSTSSYTQDDTLSTGISSYKKFNNYFNSINN